MTEGMAHADDLWWVDTLYVWKPEGPMWLAHRGDQKLEQKHAMDLEGLCRLH